MSSSEPEKHDLRVLGRAIRESREQRGVSLDSLAETSGIARGDLEAIEAGQLDPGYRRLRRVAAGLGVRPLALMLRVEELDADGGGA